jgi:hypothetical protein
MEMADGPNSVGDRAWWDIMLEQSVYEKLLKPAPL